MTDYLGTLSRRKLVILLVTVLATGAAYYITQKQAPQYDATSKVLINQNALPALPSVQPTVTDPVEIERLTSTQIALADTPAVARTAPPHRARDSPSGTKANAR